MGWIRGVLILSFWCCSLPLMPELALPSLPALHCRLPEYLRYFRHTPAGHFSAMPEKYDGIDFRQSASSYQGESFLSDELPCVFPLAGGRYQSGSSHVFEVVLEGLALDSSTFSPFGYGNW